jgi:hypothetical protein
LAHGFGDLFSPFLILEGPPALVLLLFLTKEERVLGLCRARNSRRANEFLGL